jgi:hypothetical protein
MTDRDAEEYRLLRATITQRGSVRTGALVAGLSAWSLSAAAALFSSVPLAALIPLVLLLATFEAVFALHVGAERIGRYLQTFHGDRWEETAMAFGQPLSGTSADPLFVAVFGLAAACNLVPVIAAGAVPVELLVVAAAHVVFIGRLLSARRAARRQRAVDLETFKRMRGGI